VTRGKVGKEWIKNIAGTLLDQGAEIDALIKLPASKRNQLINAAKRGEKVSAKTTAKQHTREEREKALAKKQVALPDQKFGVIVSDAEWHDETWSEAGKNSRHPSNHYPTSAADVIASRPVKKLAADDCVLLMWTTNQHLRIALDVMEKWGFEYKSNYVWDKVFTGTGRWNQSRHETLLIGTIGKPPCPAPGKQWESIIVEKRTGPHSSKPEKVMQMIEEYFPNMPKIELNCRGKPRDGWVGWGLEVEQKQAAE
jgi:N6-adenosine-specific RNA methylase IME4